MRFVSKVSIDEPRLTSTDPLALRSAKRRRIALSDWRRAQQHQHELDELGVTHKFRQELDGAWTLRFGPLPAADVAQALSAFVY